ncbi:hypothetical protein H9Q70_000700 [Fusarium xylarioides]|nr:hypothetical protein H9Q70_000700 [Fusarium xylarioides]KAG5777121.1 hypothetical protein H9Q73_009207 [Fusarium xylarioides]
MASRREGVRSRLQPKDVNAVKDQFFQKRRNSSVADISSPAPPTKRVRTARTLPTIEVASSSNAAAAATKSNDQIHLVLDPALSQISFTTPTSDDTESPQPSQTSQALSQTREPTQPFRFNTRNATTQTNTENIKDFLTESGTHPGRSRSLPPTRDSKIVGTPNAVSLHDSLDFSDVQPFDLPARYIDVHQQYSTALQHAKTQSNHSLAMLQKQLKEAHRAASELMGKIKEADSKKHAATAKATETKKTIELMQDYLGSSRRLSQHSSVLGLEEILNQQRNIHSQS